MCPDSLNRGGAKEEMGREDGRATRMVTFYYSDTSCSVLLYDVGDR